MFYHILVCFSIYIYIYISHSIPWKSVLPHQRLHGDFLGPMWRKPVALLWHRPGNSASYRIIRWWDYIDMFYLSSNIMENYLVYIYIYTYIDMIYIYILSCFPYNVPYIYIYMYTHIYIYTHNIIWEILVQRYGGPWEKREILEFTQICTYLWIVPVRFIYIFTMGRSSIQLTTNTTSFNWSMVELNGPGLP